MTPSPDDISVHETSTPDIIVMREKSLLAFWLKVPHCDMAREHARMRA